MENLHFVYADGSPAEKFEGLEPARFAVNAALPGETVVLRDNDKPMHDEPDAEHQHRERAKLAGKILTVRETFVVMNPERGTWHPRHTFEGVDGRFAGAAFEDSRGVAHHYGVLLTLDDEVWLVPLEANLENPVPRGEAFKIAGMERCARHQMMGSYQLDEDPSAADIDFTVLTEQAREPMSGEFYVVPADGGIKLFASPWNSGCSQEEIQVAHRAIEAANGAPNPGLG